MALYPIELRRCVVRQQREARMPGFSLDISQVFGGCLGEPGDLTSARSTGGPFLASSVFELGGPRQRPANQIKFKNRLLQRLSPCARGRWQAP